MKTLASWVRRAIVTGAVFSASAGAAQTIDFESLPGGGTPTPLLPLNTQYASAYGVTFSTLSGALVGFGDYGNAQEGWIGPGGADSLAPGYAGGSWFFNYDSAGLNTLIITFSPPVRSVGISVIDVDTAGGSELEAWTLSLLNGSGTVLASASIDYTNPSAGDGAMTPLAAAVGSNSVASARIVYSGAPGTNYGVGFDNLSFTRNPPGCLGDCNGDGQRDQADLALLLANYGGAGACDINGDGIVGQFDLAFLLATYGTPC